MEIEDDESGLTPLRDTPRDRASTDEILRALTKRLWLCVAFLRTLLVADAVLTPLSLFAAFEFNVEDLLASQVGRFSLASSVLDWVLVVWLRDLFMLACMWRRRRGVTSPEDACGHVRAARWVAMAVLLYGIGRLSELQWQQSTPSKCVPTFVLSSLMAPIIVLAAHVLLKSQQRLYEEFARANSYNEDTQEQYTSELTFWQTLKVMKPYFWPSKGSARKVSLNRARALSTWVCVAGSKASLLLSPIFLARATNAVSSQLQSGEGPLSARVFQNLILYAFVIFLSKALKELQSLVYIKVQQAAYIEIAENTFRHLHSLSLDWHLRKRMGNVITSIDRGVQAAQQVMQYVFLYLFPTVVESIAVALIFVLRFENTRLAVFMLLNLYLYLYLTAKVTLWRKRFRAATTLHDNELHDRLTDSLVNYETIKYFTAEDYEHREYRSVVQKFQKMSMATQASLSLLNIAQQYIISFTLAGGMIIASIHLLENGGNLGEFVAVNTYIVQTFAPLNFLGTIYNMIINAMVDMKNFGQLLAERPEVRDASNAQLLDMTICKKCPMIEFRSVSFHYKRQPSNRSIKNISFSTPRGGTTALVGTTGAGKTTITRLLFRFYDPVSGQVFINGQDVRSVTQKSLRKAMGFVPQDVVMFNATIAHNIKYGDISNSTQEMMEEAAEKAQLAELVNRQAHGYETMVGERGLKLSGGEKQRLAIARCLVKNPPIIVLDEATSALDSETEERIQQALDLLSKSKTVLAIAHRLSTVKSFQEIVVLEQGKIIEKGTHEQLLQKGGKYSDMWARQAAGLDDYGETRNERRNQVGSIAHEEEPAASREDLRQLAVVSFNLTSAPGSFVNSAPSSFAAPSSFRNGPSARGDAQKCPISGKEGACPMTMFMDTGLRGDNGHGGGRGTRHSRGSSK